MSSSSVNHRYLFSPHSLTLADAFIVYLIIFKPILLIHSDIVHIIYNYAWYACTTINEQILLHS